MKFTHIIHLYQNTVNLVFKKYLIIEILKELQFKRGFCYNKSNGYNALLVSFKTNNIV